VRIKKTMGCEKRNMKVNGVLFFVIYLFIYLFIYFFSKLNG